MLADLTLTLMWEVLGFCVKVPDLRDFEGSTSPGAPAAGKRCGTVKSACPRVLLESEVQKHKY